MGQAAGGAQDLELSRHTVRRGEGVRVPHGFLQRVQQSGRRKALHRGDLPPVGLHGEHQARTDRLAVQEDRASAARTVFAADVSAGQAQVLAQEIG
jgi:hypothetical protein